MKDVDGYITIRLKAGRAYLAFASSTSTDAITAQCSQAWLLDYLPVFLAACQDLGATEDKTPVQDLLEGSKSLLASK
jgi:hypothetical protein